MVAEPNLFDHMAACKLAEKRAIAVYGATFADGLSRRMDPWDAHEFADRASRQVPRPPPFRVPTAQERQQLNAQLPNRTDARDLRDGATDWEHRK